jgi:Spy/CpxP family protein refolding chaperone
VNSWKVILATMVIFGTGVVTGGLLVRFVDHPDRHPKKPTPAVHPAQPSSPGGVRLEFLRRVQPDLGLTPEQHDRIDKILKESQERTRKLMEPVQPHLRDEVQKTKEEFREILTPAQQTRFDELLKQQQRPREPRRQQPAREPAAEAVPSTNAP